MEQNYSKHLANADKHRDLIFAAEKYIWQNPETGYKEWKTSKYLETEFEKLGYTLTKAGNIPGFYADLEFAKKGPKVLILGELDSLICETHPEADPETKAVHSCGHNAQCAALLGIAAALKEPGATDGLSGSVRLMAVPAEELIEISYRLDLIKQGVIKYYGGKVEFMSRGFMDGVDIAYMIHTSTDPVNTFKSARGSNGLIAKKIIFTGVSSHAGGGPHLGVNALYSAMQGLNAINSLRETFIDDDHIRTHPIITYGGTAVNAIPDTVIVENFVRGANMETVIKNNHKINRALSASAAANGGGVILSDRPGYAPLLNDDNLLDLIEEAMKCVVPAENVNIDRNAWSTGSTDMGDISCVIPAVHPSCSGATGIGHGNNYYVSDVDSACVNSAKCQLILLQMLLENDAQKAKMVIDKKQLRYPSIKDYLKALDEITFEKQTVTQNPDGTITLNFAK